MMRLILLLTMTVACGRGEEGAIRDQIETLAETLSVPANEAELGRVARIAALRKAFAPDVRVAIGGSASPGAQVQPEIVGRDAMLGLVGRWVPPPGGVEVEFVDVQVTLDESGTNAQVYGTARATSGTDERPVVDARELTVGFSKIDGDWVITSVRPEETLSR
jgi:hypothetical protein